MATVKGPLFSIDASGSLGKAIVYSSWKGISYVRSHATPSNPKSAAQVAVRALLTWLSQVWAGLAGADQDSFADYLASAALSDFNRYLKYNAQRMLMVYGPADNYPFVGAGTAPSAPTTTPTGGVANVALSIADGANPGVAWQIHRGTTGFTPGPKNVIAIVQRSATPTVYIDGPLDPGTYYYRIRGVQWDADFGALEAEVSGTAT
jgi:hypothetical protein